MQRGVVMIIPPWSPELGSIAHVQRGGREPDRPPPIEPVVVRPPLDSFAVRVEIIAGDHRRVVSAPPVYVAPLAARVVINAPELQEPPQTLRLPSGEATSRGSSLQLAALDRPDTMAGRSIERLAAEARALAAYDAQLEIGRPPSSEALGQHVRVRA